MSFTLQQLRHLAAVAETGQVSLAARRCHVSQPSMTASLRKLERELGAQLFVRESRGLRLTVTGERFLPYARKILDAARDATEALDTLEPEALTGHITLGVTETISAYLLPWLLTRLGTRFPGLEVEALERRRDAIEQALVSGELEFAILLVSNITDHEQLTCRPLIRSPRRLWTHPAHPLLRRDRITLEDVSHEPYILLDMDEHVRTVGRYWHQKGLTPRVTFRSTSLEAVRSMVAQGRGVTILSDLVYRRWSLDGDRIMQRDIEDAVPSMDVGIAWARARPLTPLAATLAGLVERWAGVNQGSPDP